jgi:hypothetical protein
MVFLAIVSQHFEVLHHTLKNGPANEFPTGRSEGAVCLFLRGVVATYTGLNGIAVRDLLEEYCTGSSLFPV